MIDLHNHLLAAVDDGAATLDESRAALARYAAQGVQAVVVTPHASASLCDTPAREAFFARIDEAWEAFRAVAAAEFPALRVERGAEVMLDTPTADLSDPRLRLAGTRFALVEFPFMAVPPNAAQALFALSMAGWTPVLAHPERYPDARTAGGGFTEWQRVGALLQVNAGSLLGRYGEEPRRVAAEILEQGMASCVASDFHARGTLHLAAFRQALEERGAGELAGLLLDENPARILRGEAPLPVPRLPHRRGGSLVSRLFRGG